MRKGHRRAEGRLCAPCSEVIGNGGLATPEGIKARQFSIMWRTHDITSDDNYSQYQAGLIGDEDFARLRGIMVETLRANPGYLPLYLEFIRDYATETGFHRFARDVCSEASVPRNPPPWAAFPGLSLAG